MRFIMNPLPSELIEILSSPALVYVFGSGISSSLTGRNYGWKQWILDGIQFLSDDKLKISLHSALAIDSSTGNLTDVVGNVIEQTKKNGTYDQWMQNAFESSSLVNAELAQALRHLNQPRDIFLTTNYDLYLEEATGLGIYTKDDSGSIFQMLQSGLNSSVVHIHGAFSSSRNIDNIVASDSQYAELYDNEGAQFIQNLLGTRPLIFIGCGQTTGDMNIAHFIRFAVNALKIDVPCIFLKRKGDSAPSLPENFHIIDYGKEYDDLTGFLEETAMCRSRIQAYKFPVIGRTIYSDNGEMGMYHYANETLDFVGRKTELACLNAFLSDSRKFTWWAIVGQGGCGKSRLAYELIRKNSGSWFGFFWNDEVTDAKAEIFRLFCNTLIVIDYVQGREKKVARWMHILQEKCITSDFYVRILLVEREADRGPGSWYEQLSSEWGKYDKPAFETTAFSTEFLKLGDLDDDSVSQLIGEVCEHSGLPADSWRDRQLRDAYKEKFERLKFRPLFVWLYVEAWIANKCTAPDYDSLEGIVESALLREQERWLEFFDGNQKVVTSFIRLLIRAAAGGELTEGNIPELYRTDWDCLLDFFRNLTLPGKQRKFSHRNFLADLTQNFDQQGIVLKTYYPDIVNEYVFAYYADDDLDDVVKELRENEEEHFAAFLGRAQVDFPGNHVFRDIISGASEDNATTDMLLARLKRLSKQTVKPGETLSSLKRDVDSEYIFWHDLPYKEDVSEVDGEAGEIACIKLAGLYGCAMQYGALSLWSEMDDSLEEMLSLKGDLLIPIKDIFLEERINACSEAGYVDLAQKYQQKRRDLVQSMQKAFPDFNGFDGQLALKDANDNMMYRLIDGDIYGAKELLSNASKLTDFSDEDQVAMLAETVSRFARFQVQLGRVRFENYILPIMDSCSQSFSENADIRSASYEVRCSLIQSRWMQLLADGKGPGSKEYEALKATAITAFSEADSNDARITYDAWGIVALTAINFFAKSDETMLLDILSHAERRLAEEPSVETAKAWIVGQIKYFDLKSKVIPKSIVDQGFAYYLRDPSSETTREYFFDLIDASTEKNNKTQYMLPGVMDSIMQDIAYNPLYYDDAAAQLADLMHEKGFRDQYAKSAASDFSSHQQDIFKDMPADTIADSFENYTWNENEDMWDDTFDFEHPFGFPIVREHKKIGRNAPCPCGSGKKFKNCCMGMGIYD